MKICNKNSVLSFLREAYQKKGGIFRADIAEAASSFGLSYAQAAGCAGFYSLVNGLSAEEYLSTELVKAGPLLAYLSENKWCGLTKAKAQPDKIINEIKASGLSGRGGAAFPTWKKWLDAKESKDRDKIVICNVSEGEPGTCKDQFLLLNCPEAVIEGMAICAAAIGSVEGYVYIRAGYEAAAGSIRDAIERAQDKLGGFTIYVVENLGAYVCGEETALIASLEGLRGESSKKPPYPTQQGFEEKPTVINNAETFASVPYILSLGGNSYSKNESRLFTVTGCGVAATVCEMPISSCISDIYKATDCCGTVKAFQLGGGASGMIFPAEFMDIPLNSDEAFAKGMRIGAGSVRFISEDESLVEICGEVAEFFTNESCGKCTPCRYGCKKLSEMLGSGEYTSAQLTETAKYISSAAFCALGQSSCNTLLSALAHFPAEFISSAEKETWI